MLSRLYCTSILAGGVLATLTGCHVTGNYAQRQWSQSLRQLGVVPAYPPREDIQVGDLYLYGYDPESMAAVKDFNRGDLKIGIEPRWNVVHVLPELAAEYILRPSWPATPDAYSQIFSDTGTIGPTGATGTTGASGTTGATDTTGTTGTTGVTGTMGTTGITGVTSTMGTTGTMGSHGTTEAKTPLWKQPTGPAIFTTLQQADRLRLTEFPDFASATFSQGNLNALIPIEGITAVIGAAGSKATQISVKVPAAESYSLSSAVLMKKLVVPSGTLLSNPECDSALAKWLKRNKPEKHFPIGSSPSCSSGLNLDSSWRDVSLQMYSAPFVWLRVVTEVFYARALDIGVTTNKAGGLTTAAAVGTAPAAASSASLSSIPPAEQINQLNTTLNASQGGSTPGGSLKIMGVNSNSIAMRRVFEHPIAICTRGITLMVYVKTGTVVATQTTNSYVTDKITRQLEVPK